MGLDVGDRRIGVALSDPLGLTAQRLTLLERRSLAEDVKAVGELAARHGVELIVVGLPLTLRGVLGPQAKKVEAFILALQRQGQVPVQRIDERLTTVQGHRALREMGASRQRRGQMIDQVAAQLILQHFLEMQRGASTTAPE